jgi:iron complex outermembrane receptor protein
MFSGIYSPHPTKKGVSLLTWQNVGKARVQGVENQVTQRLGDHLSATVNLTWNRSRIVEDPVNLGHAVANTPHFMGNVTLGYQDPRIVSGAITYRYVSDQFIDNENTELPYYHLDRYETVDLKLWRTRKLAEKTRLKLALSVENLLDKQFAQQSLYQNPGRTATGTAAVTWLF